MHDVKLFYLCMWNFFIYFGKKENHCYKSGKYLHDYNIKQNLFKHT
jgi:hypothetical protein